MNQARAHKTEAGLGIVEVIASLLILSLCLLPLMDMAQSLQFQSQAVEERQARAEKVQSALAYFRVVNVGTEPQGDRNFGDWSLFWNAKLVDESSTFTHPGNRGGTRTVGLFSVDITLTYELSGQARQSRYTTRAVGWVDNI